MNDYVTKEDLDDSLEKFKTEIKEEFRRHTGIILEEFDKRINLVIEGQEVLTERVDKLDTKVTNLETKVDKLDTKVTNLETKVDKLDTKVTKLKTKVDNIHEELLSHRNNTELHAPMMKQKGKKQA